MPSKLKPTLRQNKLIEREKLEEVELKPSKILKSTIEKEMLEDVSLKPVPKQVTDESLTTQVLKIKKDAETIEKLKIEKDVIVSKTQDKKIISHKEESILLDVETVSL